MTAKTTSAANKLGLLLVQLGAEAVVMDGLDAVPVGEAVAEARPDAIVRQMTAISVAHAGKPDMKHVDRWFATTNRLRTEGTNHLRAATEATGVSHFVAQSYASWTGNAQGRMGEAAVAVCAADTGRPSHPQEAADRGPRTYLASMFAIPSELERKSADFGAYAARYSMVVAFANYGGPSGGLASGGGSAIWSERGELSSQLEATGAGVAVATESHSGWRARTIMLGGY